MAGPTFPSFCVTNCPPPGEDSAGDLIQTSSLFGASGLFPSVSAKFALRFRCFLQFFDCELPASNRRSTPFWTLGVRAKPALGCGSGGHEQAVWRAATQIPMVTRPIRRREAEFGKPSGPPDEQRHTRVARNVVMRDHRFE